MDVNELIKAAEEISNLSKEELSILSRSLAESDLDVEKLDRLQKLAARASALSSTKSAAERIVSHHY
jgi:hypothetical protein